jgi:hypothetical protein
MVPHPCILRRIQGYSLRETFLEGKYVAARWPTDHFLYLGVYLFCGAFSLQLIPSLLCIRRAQVKAYPATMKGKLGKLPKAVTKAGSETSVERHFFLSEERSAEVPIDVIFPPSSTRYMHYPLRSHKPLILRNLLSSFYPNMSGNPLILGVVQVHPQMELLKGFRRT